MRRERQFLEDIVSAADAIAAFIENETSDSFEEHQMLRSAVVHELTVVGEAVAHLSQELRLRHPSVPWQDIKGLRNIVIHNYFGIDWAEVWRAAKRDVPVLRNQVAAILQAEFPA
jgi:uncharacterized protein with HEPN domain